MAGCMRYWVVSMVVGTAAATSRSKRLAFRPSAVASSELTVGGSWQWSPLMRWFHEETLVEQQIRSDGRYES